MSVIKSNGAGSGASGGFYNGVATTSLRFDHGSSPYLSFTPSSTGDRKIWTWSGWIKRTSLSSGDHHIYSSWDGSGSGYNAFYFSGNKLATYFDPNNNYGTISDRLFRDFSSWYHIVHQVDAGNTSQKVWVNGEEQTLSSGRNPANNNYQTNTSGRPMIIGKHAWGTSAYNNMQLAEVNYMDGQKYQASDFGETKNGVWIAKEPSGITYGTNGYRLQFKNTGTGTASSSTIGADTSGNNNHFTSYNISASDCAMPDSPENNFCTLNPLNTNDSRGEASFSEGNLRITSTSSNRGFSTGTFKLTGKHYFEVYYKADNSGFIGINDINNNAGGSTSGQSIHVLDGTVRIDGTAGSSVTSFSTGDVIGVEVDVDAKSIQFFKNGSSVSNNTYSTDAEYFPFIYDSSGGRAMDLIVNFGQDATFAGNKTSGSDDASDSEGQGIFYETPSSGFLALCTSNIPEPTIGPNSDTQADDHFNTVIYDGSNSSQTITTGLQPDWIWIKVRSLTGYHNITDTSRGITRELYSNTTDDEENNSRVSSTSSTGFTLAGAYGYTNEGGQTFVSWNWHANGGTTSTNNDGSGTSTVQVNTDAGFSIVLYTGNATGAGAEQTIGHGLGVKPDWILFKGRDTSYNWYSTHVGLANGTTTHVELDTDAAEHADADYMNAVAPTSSVFSLGYNFTTNQNTKLYVAYCFHSVEGYSKFGSYTANESTDGVFIHLGFRPAWAMIKRLAGNGWAIQDSKRSTINPVSNLLQANGSNAEYTTGVAMDFLSNGIKMRNDSGFFNHVSGDTFIYMAFAEAPFKYANAR